MDLPVVPYQRPFCPAALFCEITGMNRNTLLGHINRYGEELSQIGITPVVKGSTRFFTMEQVGIFATIRAGILLQQSDAVLDALSAIADHAKTLYRELAPKGQWKERVTKVNRPWLPPAEEPAHLQAQVYLGGQWRFAITKEPYSRSVQVGDILGFPVPIMLIPLDETLRNAWMRALWAFNDVELEDY